jgi:hypothetical protein
MRKLENFLAKHDKAILRLITALFLVPLVVVALVDMDNVLAVIGLVVGYVVTTATFFIIRAGSLN